MPPAYRLRLATEHDARLYFEWANDPQVRKNSFNQCAISLEEHESWFSRKLVSANVLMLVIEIDGSPEGQIRFDLDDDVATIGFSVARAARGRGLGTQLLEDGMRWLIQLHASVHTVRGSIKLENVASRRAFEAAGFRQNTGAQTESGVLIYDYVIAQPGGGAGSA